MGEAAVVMVCYGNKVAKFGICNGECQWEWFVLDMEQEKYKENWFQSGRAEFER